MKLLNFSTFCLLILLVQADKSTWQNDGTEAGKQLRLGMTITNKCSTACTDAYDLLKESSPSARGWFVPACKAECEKPINYTEAGRKEGKDRKSGCNWGECCYEDCRAKADEKWVIMGENKENYENFFTGCTETCDPFQEIIINKCGNAVSDGNGCGAALKEMCSAQDQVDKSQCCQEKCYTAAVKKVWDEKQKNVGEYENYYRTCVGACNARRTRQRRA